ncbi:MAG TPA: ankyrin repeat domain-containing protein [Parachlamydiaceae bacterium]|nr:ankyrin repeat domain-containing protein [Parachlamydiaceae bacterium]
MLSVTQPDQDLFIFHTLPENRRTITSEASKAKDIKYGLGRERLRLKLSAIDHVNKFAIALLEDQETKTPENGEWVYLYSDTGPVKAIISSIVGRLSIPESKVRTLAAAISHTCIELNPLSTALEDSIQEIIEKYETKVDTVKCFLAVMTDDSPNANKEELALKFIYVDLENFRSDHDFKAIRKAAKECFCNKDFSNMEKMEINLIADAFRTKLSRIDQNFVLNAPAYREKITDCTIWKNHPFLIGNYCQEDRITGFNLVTEYPEHYGPRYVVETDGYCYNKKPKMNNQFVPFSKEGKIWILLNIYPLSRYLDLDLKKIRKAAAGDENLLNQMINKKIPNLNKGVFHHKFKDSPVLTVDLSQEIFKYLNLSDLNALCRLNRQYKPDIDLAMMTIARQNGYEGCDVVEAHKYLKQNFINFDEEIRVLCEMKIYPHQKILYDNWIFDKKVLPKKTYQNFKNFNAEDLFELFKNEKLYIPFFEKTCGELIKKRGKETLLMAAKHGDADVITQLLKHGVDVNIRNSKGNSPLHFAAYHGNEEVIKVLLDNHADVNCINDLGETPVFLAYNYKNKNLYDVINLLKDRGADYTIMREDGMHFIDFVATKQGYNLALDQKK